MRSGDTHSARVQLCVTAQSYWDTVPLGRLQPASQNENRGQAIAGA